VFAFTTRDDVEDFTVFDVSDSVRARGWQVPAYTMPQNLEHLAVLRIVVRNGMSRDMADLLLDDIRRAVAHLEKHGRPTTAEEAHVAYHH